MSEFQRESVQDMEIGPNDLSGIAALFEAVELKFMSVLSEQENTPGWRYVIFDRDPHTEQRLARFGLCDDYENYMRHGLDAQYIEVAFPVSDDLQTPLFDPNVNPERCINIMLRRGEVREALVVHNFKIDNFGQGETERIPSQNTDEMQPGMDPALTPSQRLAAVIKKIEDFPLVPLR